MRAATAPTEAKAVGDSVPWRGDASGVASPRSSDDSERRRREGDEEESRERASSSSRSMASSTA
jgi:hypothetical protein